MSDVSANDNKPAEELSLHVELGHALVALMNHERQIKRLVMVPLPNNPKPLGEIIMRLGEQLKKWEDGVEEKKPRILPATPSSISAVVRDIASAKRDTGIVLGGK